MVLRWFDLFWLVSYVFLFECLCRFWLSCILLMVWFFDMWCLWCLRGWLWLVCGGLVVAVITSVVGLIDVQVFGC